MLFHAFYAQTRKNICKYCVDKLHIFYNIFQSHPSSFFIPIYIFNKFLFACRLIFAVIFLMIYFPFEISINFRNGFELCDPEKARFKLYIFFI
jgi:hypothetical protein